jgi:hypothetical protein
LVGRVAKKLWEKQKDLLGAAWFHSSETWEGLPYGAQEEWFVLAKAALRALGLLKEGE